MIWPLMNQPVIRKMLFTITFPVRDGRSEHIPRVKMYSLLRRQLPDLDVIETIDHLFRCHRCLETYRYIRKDHLDVGQKSVATGAR
jgi:hypothetical protein